jgi:hypothetical protein
MFLFVTPSFPFTSPKRLRQLRQAMGALMTAFVWAMAITYTADRLARIGFEWARPYLAKVMHALALLLDGGLAYPDQPEPDPTPDPGRMVCIPAAPRSSEGNLFCIPAQQSNSPAARMAQARLPRRPRAKGFSKKAA